MWWFSLKLYVDIVCRNSEILLEFVWYCVRPTQSIFDVPLQVNRSQKSVLLIVQHKYSKSCSRDCFSRIWSSAQDHAVLVLLINLVGFFISTRSIWSGGNDFYHSCTSFEGASRGGQPLNIFSWFTGAGGLMLCHVVCRYPMSIFCVGIKWYYVSIFWEIVCWEYLILSADIMCRYYVLK